MPNFAHIFTNFLFDIAILKPKREGQRRNTKNHKWGDEKAQEQTHIFCKKGVRKNTQT